MKEKKSDKEEYSENFACLSPKEIAQKQETEITVVADLCNLSRSDAGSLLRFFQWKKEKLLASYFENPSRVIKEAGIQFKHNDKTSTSIEKSSLHSCSICGDDYELDTCTALSCSHMFCNQCWKEYLTLKIKEGVTQIKCPQTNCNIVVDQETIKKLTPPEVFIRYLGFFTKSFVEESDGRVKWCPQPNCGNAISVTADMIKSFGLHSVVKCECGYRFCFWCHREAHAPATCDQVKEWEKKCADDSETTHWKYANCKDCPKCDLAVEKNGGCNHMTCYKCKHEWCWVCMRPWKGHNDYYNCNKFKGSSPEKKRLSLSILQKSKSKKDKIKEREEDRERHRIILERYLHYYSRFLNHSHSRDLEKQIMDKAVSKMNELQNSSAFSTTSEVQYIIDGTNTLLECRNVLKYTYVYAYYLPDNNENYHLIGSSSNIGSTKPPTLSLTLFEYLQEALEKSTEQLSEVLETVGTTNTEETAQLARSQEERLKALNIIAVASTRKSNLIKSVEQGPQDEFL